MIKITIDNSICKLKGLSERQFGDLRELLSYTKNNFQSKSRFGRYTQKFLMDVKCQFPTGLLYLVQEYFKGQKIQIVDKRIIPRESKALFKLERTFRFRPEQLEAASKANIHERGIIVAPTGFGKSAIIQLLIFSHQLKTLVVVPSLELKKQLSESLTKAFGSLDNISVENVDSIKIGDKTKYDVVIIDEFHHSGAKTYRNLNEKNWNRTYYKFGLTATPFRSKDEENILLESVLSQVIYEVSYQLAVDKGYIVPMEAFYIEVPPTKPKGNQRSWPTIYKELVTNCDARNAVLIDLLLKIHVTNASTICLVKEISHGDNLSQDGVFPFVSGQNDERYTIDLFNKGTIKTLIGTDGVLGEGIDTKPAEFIIIAGLGRSRNRFMQGCGRGFRLYPGKGSCKIIIIKDNSHKWCLNHFKAQCKILKEEYGVIPLQLFI